MGFLDSLLTPSNIKTASDKIFDTFDVDKSGGLDAKEIEAAVEKAVHILPGASTVDIPPGAIQKALTSLDKDKSGALDKAEFAELVTMVVKKIPLPAGGAAPPPAH